MNARIALFAAVLATASCATVDDSGPDPSLAAKYEANIADIPTPTTAEQHAAVCRDLRVERARQEGLAAQMRSRVGQSAAGNFEMIAGRNGALLESKMAELGCDRPFDPE